MTTEPEYTTHTLVTISLPQDMAAALVKEGLASYEPSRLTENVTREEFLDALGLVTREAADKLRNLHNERGTALESLRTKLKVVRAELDQAWAREAAVRAATAIWGEAFRPAVLAALDSEWVAVTADQIREGDEVRRVWQSSGGIDYTATGTAHRRDYEGDWISQGDGLVAFSDTEGERLYRRVKPAPEFVLPTEVPATIEAKDSSGHLSELTLCTDGRRLWWHDANDYSDWSPEQVMSDFTDHRVIEP